MTLLAQVSELPASKPFYWSAPGWLQIGGIIWVFIGCLAIRMVLDSIPNPAGLFYAQLRMSLIQLVVAGSSTVFAWFLIPQSHIYAIIVGLSCSGISVQFYATFFQWISLSLMPALMAKLSAILNIAFGINLSKPAEPLEPDFTKPQPPQK